MNSPNTLGDLDGLTCMAAFRVVRHPVSLHVEEVHAECPFKQSTDV
jgi:hypothetical protein